MGVTEDRDGLSGGYLKVDLQIREIVGTYQRFGVESNALQADMGYTYGKTYPGIVGKAQHA